MKKILLVITGCISLGLGSLGIIIPGLPTTPFLLLSAWCFANSSEKFHRWLMDHKIFGQYIKDFKETGGVQLKIKVIAILFMWLGLAVSFWKIENQFAFVAVLFLVLFGTILLTLIIPTVPVKTGE